LIERVLERGLMFPYEIINEEIVIECSIDGVWGTELKVRSTFIKLQLYFNF
jgi:hypothetical protein